MWRDVRTTAQPALRINARRARGVLLMSADPIREVDSAAYGLGYRVVSVDWGFMFRVEYM